ncbi:MAG: hypothetical protein EOP04_15935, partial [Proteobacteria bacterium]
MKYLKCMVLASFVVSCSNNKSNSSESQSTPIAQIDTKTIDAPLLDNLSADCGSTDYVFSQKGLTQSQPINTISSPEGFHFTLANVGSSSEYITTGNALPAVDELKCDQVKSYFGLGKDYTWQGKSLGGVLNPGTQFNYDLTFSVDYTDSVLIRSIKAILPSALNKPNEAKSLKMTIDVNANTGLSGVVLGRGIPASVTCAKNPKFTYSISPSSFESDDQDACRLRSPADPDRPYECAYVEYRYSTADDCRFVID